MDWAAGHSYDAADIREAMGHDQKALNYCWRDTGSCPGPYPTATCPEFLVGCRLD